MEFKSANGYGTLTVPDLRANLEFRFRGWDIAHQTPLDWGLAVRSAHADLINQYYDWVEQSAEMRRDGETGQTRRS